MRLCTFEVHTHLGWQSRLGAVDDDGVVDLNFAAAPRKPRSWSQWDD